MYDVVCVGVCVCIRKICETLKMFIFIAPFTIIIFTHKVEEKEYTLNIQVVLLTA